MTDLIFTVGEHRYEVAGVDTFTYREARLARRLSGGLGPEEFDDALLEQSQDAWYALLFISMLRQRPDATEAELEEANFVEVMNPVVEAINEKIVAALADLDQGDQQDPPIVAGEASAASPAAEETIPEGSGVL